MVSNPHFNISDIQIQTVSWCNRDCIFCPSQKFPIEKQTMDEKLFDKIISNLQQINYSGRVSLYLMNEPLLDKNLESRILKVNDLLPNSYQMISTNSDALSEERALDLFNSGLNVLLVNCYDNDDQRVSRMNTLAKNIKKQLPDLVVKPAGLFNRLFDIDHIKYKDAKVIKVLNSSKFGLKTKGITNRAGNVPALNVVEQPLKKSCYRPFEQLYIRYNGDVVLCCCDWKGEVIFGNLNDSTIEEAFNSELAQKYRSSLSRKDRNLTLCNACDFNGDK